jgi:hypothetical protein
VTLRVLVVLLLVSATTVAAQMPGGGMPDVRQMSGIPLPVADLPPGTVSVRVVRGALTNVVSSHSVELIVSGEARSAATNNAGRAEFRGLPLGARVKAVTTLDGQRLESQEFAVPSSGGIRLMLVGAAPGAAGTGAETGSGQQLPARPGSLALGDQSRFVFELADEALTGFYLLQIVNGASGPVQPTEPFVIELPDGAEGPAILQGSSPQASVAGKRLVVNGPFASGTTQVQVAFSLPYSSAALTVEQRLPVPLSQLTILVQKVGTMEFSSPQTSNRRLVNAQSDTYFLGQGPGLKAGATLTFNFSGLPHAPVWPRNLALGLAALVLVVGLWASLRPPRRLSEAEERRRALVARRERLFGDLAEIEEQHRAGMLERDRYDVRRGELMAALERIYAEMDEEAAA